MRPLRIFVALTLLFVAASLLSSTLFERKVFPPSSLAVGEACDTTVQWAESLGAFTYPVEQWISPSWEKQLIRHLSGSITLEAWGLPTAYGGEVCSPGPTSFTSIQGRGRGSDPPPTEGATVR